VPEENRYLRYEDVIVITPSGYENFTAFLPTELDDIEKLVGEGGVLQKVPAGGPISRVDRSGTPQ
jgi:Xaa-Pro aminopeptidase